jgi:hypothetical protein
MKLEVFDKFSNNTQISNFMKNGTRVIPYIRADGQMDRETDMAKLIVAFCNVASIQ